MFERGRLYWCHLPDDPKRRPVLVVSPDLRNALASDIVVIPASTMIRVGPWHVVLRKGEGGVAHPTVLKCEQPATIRKSRLASEPLGRRLGVDRMSDVAAAIIRALELRA
ncbi:MAG: type II toxin-antitoxin system PemK/MazF family toxin [Deltaproteobacteria bacterium]|nr:type II toxin-antitoxin system PemK/MazF family toxin [Deltaproteobacteria bacterium]